jgi:hypothetical protein
MDTVWDWVTVFCFAGLVTLLLQRSSEDNPRDHLWQYAPPAVGLAVANYVGNHEMAWLAIVLLLAVGAYVALVLKPVIRGRSSRATRGPTPPGRGCAAALTSHFGPAFKPRGLSPNGPSQSGTATFLA